jgi:hypothetical protein
MPACTLGGPQPDRQFHPGRAQRDPKDTASWRREVVPVTLAAMGTRPAQALALDLVV